MEPEWKVFTHNNYDVNNDAGTQEYPNQDDIKEESEEQSAEEYEKCTEFYSNRYNENRHLVHYVEDEGRTCVQEKHLEYAEDANEEYLADQVLSPQQTERTKQVSKKKKIKKVTEETHETHNSDIDNFILEKWLCGPHPDEGQLVELMMQPPPPLPDPLPYVKCEDSQEFRCIYCAYRNRREGLLIKHYRHKHGPRYIYCFACGDTFSTKFTLTTHERMICKAEGIAVVRRVRRALSQSELWRQQWNEKLSKNHHKRKGGYVAPKQVHRNSRSYTPKCRACGQEFVDAASVKLHQQLRRECRPFRCEFCPTAFTSSSSLHHHIESHLTHRFICDNCGKGFYKKSTLAFHIRSHVNKKRFKCQFCEACFTQNRSLIVHEAKHTGAQAPHICSVCDAGFWRLEYLKSHMEKIHGMSIVTKKKMLKLLPTMSQEDMESSELIKGLEQTKRRPAPAGRATRQHISARR